jgi:putative ATP-dependent endonuclease of the OLD family
MYKLVHNTINHDLTGQPRVDSENRNGEGMKISEIQIQHFRSIEKASIKCTDFNIYVGQNNAGKTNMFEAIEWFYNGTPRDATIRDLTFRRGDPKSLSVEISFSGAQGGATKMLNAANQTKMLEVLGKSDIISVRRCGDHDNKRIIVVEGKEIEKLPTGFDKAFNDFLPKFEYVNTKQYFDAVAKYNKKTPVGIMLSGVLTTILEKSQQYKEFQLRFADLFEDDKSEIKLEFDKLGSNVQVHLEKQFPDCTKVSFEVRPPVFDDLLKNFDTSVDDGIETTADEKGDGMQRALMLAIIQAYSDFRKQDEDVGKSASSAEFGLKNS